MENWGKIDWYCQNCDEYWMTTENCSPYWIVDCDCSYCAEGNKMAAVGRCGTCGKPVEWGENVCEHIFQKIVATK